MTALWWIRRDLRLSDNQALARALAHGGAVVPVFVLDPALLERTPHRDAGRRQAFLFSGLRALDESLRERGSRLVVRRGDPAVVLADLCHETGATVVVAEEDVSPYARRRDAALRRAVPLELTPGVSVHHPRVVHKADGEPYTVFSAFARAWAAVSLPSRADIVTAPRTLPAVTATLHSDPLPAAAPLPGFPAGEAEAIARLRRFTRGDDAAIAAYGDGRDRVDRDGTSTLSPYLRFGMVSARRAAVAAQEAGGRAEKARGAGGPSVWLSELVWREFYLAILFHFPDVLRQAFNPKLRDVPWRNAPDELRAWQEGRTGYPIVDAAMRQLAATGWMHNRARMIVASFLTKDLLIDWRAGEAWFMRQLVDGDPAANNGGWQWTAGTGTDAAPYFRIMSPIRQAERFDPDGGFVRRWVPELARLPAPQIHQPWTAAPDVRIDDDYPAPIVDHRMARERALAAYGRGSSR